MPSAGSAIPAGAESHARAEGVTGFVNRDTVKHVNALRKRLELVSLQLPALKSFFDCDYSAVEERRKSECHRAGSDHDFAYEKSV